MFIGDDDCSTLSKIREEVVYHVEKWSDTVHAKRTLINHLHKLKTEKSFPRGESVLSNKVIDYLGKCFSYSVAQNAGNTDGLQKALIVPLAFGNHEHCLQSWCGYKQDPASYKHRDLPFGKDLVGESLKNPLEEVFEIYSSENVIKKLGHNASSQRNESLNSTIGSKNPKIRFYGGSESADQRVACSVAQKNLGKQYLLNVLQSANINPGCTMTSQVSKMDYERKQDQLRKQSKDFKKKRKQLRNVRSSKEKRLESREGTVYESGSTLSLDPEVINAASIQIAEICKFEQQVPKFCFGKLEDTRHLTLVLNTTLSFTTQKQIVVVKKPRSSNYLLFVTVLAIRSRNLSCLNMILMYMQVISTSSTLHRSATNVYSTEMVSLYKPFLFQNVYCLSLTS